MDFFRISYFVLIGVLGIMAVVFLAIPVRQKRLDGYEVSLRVMALSYASLAVYCMFKWAVPIQLFSFYFLLMSSLQCTLLGLSHINLIHPQLVTTRFVSRHLIPIGIMATIYASILIRQGHVELSSYEQLMEKEIITNPEVLVRVLWMAYYIGYIIYFGIHYFMEEKIYRMKEDNFFSETDSKAVYLVRFSFCLALCVALTTVGITLSLDVTLSAVFNYLILPLYTLMGLCYIHYPAFFQTMEPVLYDSEEIAGVPATMTRKTRTWGSLRKQIITERLYVRKGITLEDLSMHFGIARTTLSAMINQQEGVNFNTFVRHLRIQEACRLLEYEPEILFSVLAEQVEYSEQSNLARHFKAEKACTLNEYREEILAHKKAK